jgi:ketosteroid isomerase-like protein
MSENVEIVRKLYEASQTGDMDYVLSVIHPDVVLYEPDSLPYHGVHRGTKNLMNVVGIFMQTWKNAQIEPKTFLDAGEYVIAMVHLSWENQRTGGLFETDLAEFWKLEDGKIVEVRPFYWDTAEMLKTLP